MCNFNLILTLYISSIFCRNITYDESILKTNIKKTLKTTEISIEKLLKDFTRWREVLPEPVSETCDLPSAINPTTCISNC